MNEVLPPPLPPAAPAHTGPLPFSRLLDEAMKRARRHIRVMYLPVALPLAVIAAAAGVFQALWMQKIMAEAGSGTPPTFSLGSIAAGLVLAFAVGFGMMALQKAAVDALLERPIDMKAAWRFAFRLEVIGTTLLQGLAVMASVLACCVGMLYVAPLLALVGPVMVAEGRFGTSALSRSADLTRYNPGGMFSSSPLLKALGLMVVAAMISYAASAIVTLPFQIPMMINMFRQIAAGKEPALDAMSKFFWYQVPVQVLQMMVTTAVYVFATFGYALLFFDLKNRKEGTDLAAEIDAVFGPDRPAGDTPS